MPPPPTTPDEGDLLARAFNVDCEGPNSFTKLARYESSIERSIDRCLRQLKTYQAARTTSTPQVGQAAPPAEAATPSKSTNYYSNPKMGVSPNLVPLPCSSYCTPSSMPCRNSSQHSPVWQT